jgi:multiple sugar transport system substrate-binding protein
MTIQSRHRAVSSALTIAALLAGSACGGTAHRAVAPTPITISFLSYNYGTPDLGGRGTQHLIDAFEAVYPAIRIAPMGVATKDVLTTLRADEAAGHAPDVAQIGWSKMAEACASLPIAPIQDIPSEQDWSVHVEDMSPPLMDAVSQNGRVKVMPYTVSMPIMYYNADLFLRAGLDPTLAGCPRARRIGGAHPNAPAGRAEAVWNGIFPAGT